MCSGNSPSHRTIPDMLPWTRALSGSMGIGCGLFDVKKLWFPKQPQQLPSHNWSLSLLFVAAIGKTMDALESHFLVQRLRLVVSQKVERNHQFGFLAWSIDRNSINVPARPMVENTGAVEQHYHCIHRLCESFWQSMASRTNLQTGTDGCWALCIGLARELSF